MTGREPAGLGVGFTELAVDLSAPPLRCPLDVAVDAE